MVESLNADASGIDQTIAAACPLWLARYKFATRIAAVGDDAAERARVDAPPWPPVSKAWGDQGNVWVHQYQGDALGVPGTSSTVDLNRFRGMKLGETGARVTWMQRRIGMAEGAPGVFDARMAAAVVAFQQRCGLVADGVVGLRTFAHAARCG